MNIHYFGSNIPVNPDNVPENQSYGQGTERPLSFNESSIFRLYWTVRNFQVDVQSISQNDPLSEFLGNGAPLNLLQALNSLNNVGLGSNLRVAGYTKPKALFTQKKRRGTRDGNTEIDIMTMEGVVNNLTQKKITMGNNLPFLSSSTSNINEGHLCSAGPIHSLVQSQGGVTIDFSNIKYYKGLYWPRIIVRLSNATSVSSVGTYAKLGGGIVFESSTTTIPLYSTENNINSLARVALGVISVGKRCGDRFVYDDFDKERKENGCPGLN